MPPPSTTCKHLMRGVCGEEREDATSRERDARCREIMVERISARNLGEDSANRVVLVVSGLWIIVPKIDCYYFIL